MRPGCEDCSYSCADPQHFSPSTLLILDEDNLVGWALSHRVRFGACPELAPSADVGKLVDAEVAKVNATLTHVEAIKKLRVLERRLDRDEGELTPTLEVRRRAVEQKYAELIEGMYT